MCISFPGDDGHIWCPFPLLSNKTAGSDPLLVGFSKIETQVMREGGGGEGMNDT